MGSAAFTIKELSSLSGYSVSTVSKALNDKEDVSIATRNIIKAMAKKFNYVPNNYAVALRVKKKQSIAVVLPMVTQKSYNQALYFLQKSAEDFGYRILLYQSFNSSSKEINYIKGLNDGSTDGIILISENNKNLTNYTNHSIPIELLVVKDYQSQIEIEEHSHNSLNRLLMH